VRSCVRPVDAARTAARPNALRGSGPNPKHAFECAMSQAGSPDPWNDCVCITSLCRQLRLCAGIVPAFAVIGVMTPATNRCRSAGADPCPSRKSYPRVAMMQFGQEWCDDDGPCSKQPPHSNHLVGDGESAASAAAASFDHLVGEREQFDRADDSPSSKKRRLDAHGFCRQRPAC